MNTIRSLTAFTHGKYMRFDFLEKAKISKAQEQFIKFYGPSYSYFNHRILQKVNYYAKMREEAQEAEDELGNYRGI